MKEIEVLTKQYKLNWKLAEMLKVYHIDQFRMTSLGNSIASGYSMVRTTKPLLFRNEHLGFVMKSSNILLERYHFARAQNNNDEHIYRWLTSNISELQIYKSNRCDYGFGPNSMPVHGLTDEDMKRFYPFNKKNDKGLQDVIFETGEGLSNIVIYNGCTGSFLDNITREGKISEMFTYGIKRDITSLEAVLKYIQDYNRSGFNTQVYLCGAPNFLSLGISNVFINNHLKKIAKNYANVTYVEPVRSKMFYVNCETRKIGVDIHYDEVEYLKLNNNIIDAILKNYAVKKALIQLDRELFHYSEKIEIANGRFDDLQDYACREKLFDGLLADAILTLDDKRKNREFLIEARDYLFTRVPYDFHYFGKKLVKNTMDSRNIRP